MSRRGFTLVEVALVSGATTVVAVAVYVLMSAGQRAWFTGSAVVSIQDQMRRAFSVIGEGLRSTGNEEFLMHVRVDQRSSCPHIVYQVPLDAGNYGVTGWGALNPPTASVPTVSAVPGGTVWIHRSTKSDGTGDLCTGPLLVQEVRQYWVFPPYRNGPVWLSTDAIPAGALKSIRVLATDVEGFSVQAYEADGITRRDWQPPDHVTWFDATWSSMVYQVEVRLQLKQAAAIGPPAELEQMMRVQLRNRFRSP